MLKLQDLNEIIKDNQNEEESKVKTERFVMDEFYAFRTKMSRLVKDMVSRPEKTLLINVQRNMLNHSSRQVEYIIEVVDKNMINVFDPQQQKIAVPVSPDFPEVEKEKDPTVILKK